VNSPHIDQPYPPEEVHKISDMSDNKDISGAAVGEGSAPSGASHTSSSKRDELLAELRSLYEVYGVQALAVPFLKEKRLYQRLRPAGLTQSVYLTILGLADEYHAYTHPWPWERIVEVAGSEKERHGELPTLEWFRKNGPRGLASAVFQSGHTWEQVRDAVGCFASSTFRTSRNGMRWLSQPEVSMSDFLYARAVKHKYGDLYAPGYAEQSGRRHGKYDLHFAASNGQWIDVEIWGDLPDHLTEGKYGRTRELKEAWNADNPNFLGIQFTDCLFDDALTRILKPFIGVIEPFQFEKAHDRLIETTHWTSALELLETCRDLAAQMPDGIFPNEQWLRMRGNYADRPGPTFNYLAIRVQQWLGGTRKVRELLGQTEASTTAWTPEIAVGEWRAFEIEHGLTPTQMFAKHRRTTFPPEVVKRAQNIRAAARRLGVLDHARAGKKAYRVVWTEETVRAA
jgi:hypothetical protein